MEEKNNTEISTMKVYEELTERKSKEGKLDLNLLTRDNLYIMYIVQDKFTSEIAELFDVNTYEISKKCKNYKLRTIDSTIWYRRTHELVKKACASGNAHLAYYVLKRLGVFNFERHIYDILKYIEDGKVHLLKEFWQFTKGKREGLELERAKDNKEVYFRAYLCAKLLKQNYLLDEVDYLTYKITKEGKQFFKQCSGELTLIQMCNILKIVNFYSMIMTKKEDGNITCYSNPDFQYEGLEDLEDDEDDEILFPLESEFLRANQYLKEPVLDELQEIDIENKIKDKSLRLTLISPKEISYKKSENKVSSTKELYSNRNIEFEKEYSKNSVIGQKGEEAVVAYEKEYLRQHGKDEYVKDVHRTADTNSNTESFDVLSFELDGTPKFIEVKTTTGRAENRFHISEKEVEFSHRYTDNYYLYRVYNFNPDTMEADLIIIPGAIDRKNLKPTNYTCQVSVE